jgi:hypothetical protein
LKSSDSGRLGGNLSKDLCVTGTFTLDTPPRVAPHQRIMVMA